MFPVSQDLFLPQHHCENIIKLTKSPKKVFRNHHWHHWMLRHTWKRSPEPTNPHRAPISPDGSVTKFRRCKDYDRAWRDPRLKCTRIQAVGVPNTVSGRENDWACGTHRLSLPHASARHKDTSEARTSGVKVLQEGRDNLTHNSNFVGIIWVSRKAWQCFDMGAWDEFGMVMKLVLWRSPIVVMQTMLFIFESSQMRFWK